jgi:predicted transcriptional regulator
MTEERLNDLLATSENADSLDSAVVRELFEEFDRLRAILDEPVKLQKEAVVLTENLAELRKQIRQKINETAGQYHICKEKIEELNYRNNLIANLIESCLPHISHPETADHVRRKLSGN